MMILARGRYTLHVMVGFAEHIGSSHIPLKDIAEQQQISEKYLESVVKILVRNSLLNTFRGEGDGYRLSRSSVEYTVGSILRFTEDSLVPVARLEGEATYRRATYYCTLSMQQKLDHLVNGFFDGYTPASLAAPNLAGNDFAI